MHARSFQRRCRSRRDAGGGAGAFTLIELLVVVLIVGILAAMLFPVLSRSKAAARRAQCLNNLRQLALATHLYWDENGGKCFRYTSGVTNGGQLYWVGWIGAGQEGERLFDAGQGVLYPYLRGRGLEVCPAFEYTSPQLKLKTTGASYGYGYNWFLSVSLGRPPVSVSRIVQPARILLFGDAAQVNTWQAPAAPNNPLLEEWYYVDMSKSQPNGHFRHKQRALAVFCDGHVAVEMAVTNSWDGRLPSQYVGRFREEALELP